MTEHSKPVPVITEDAIPFYAATKERKLSLQKCSSCGAFRFPPSPVCPECSALGGEWSILSGRGKVFSFVVCHRAFHKGFDADVPYVVAVIELAEGPRLISNVVGVPPDRVRCDMPVEVVFEEMQPDVTLPKFKPVV